MCSRTTTTSTDAGGDTPVGAFLTDLPLICDDLLAFRLSLINVDAIVLSDQLLRLWRVRELVDIQTADATALRSKTRDPQRDWDLGADGQVATLTPAQPDYVATLRYTSCVPAERQYQLCLNPAGAWQYMERPGVQRAAYSTADDKACESRGTLRVVPASRAEEYLRTRTAANVLFFDQPELFLRSTLRYLPNVLFAFTTPVYDCSAFFRQTQCALETARVRSPSQLKTDEAALNARATGTAWRYFVNNEALLPSDRVFRFRVSLDDSYDSVFWRNLLAQLLHPLSLSAGSAWSGDNRSATCDREAAKRDGVAARTRDRGAKTSGNGDTPIVLVEAILGGSGETRTDELALLRFKRFLAFFARFVGALSARERYSRVATAGELLRISTGEKPASSATTAICCCWTVPDRDKERIYRLLSDLYDEASLAAAWNNLVNFDCFVNDAVGATESDEGYRKSRLPRLVSVGCGRGDIGGERGGAESAGGARFEAATANSDRVVLNLRADNVVGLRGDSLLDIEVSRGVVVRHPVAGGYLCADGYTVVNRYRSRAPVMKLVKARFR